MRSTILRAAAQAARRADSEMLKKGAKRDPELWVSTLQSVTSLRLTHLKVLFGVMSGAFGLAGYYFARKPTSPVSEVKVSVAQMPWEDTSSGETQANFKYKYHPGANPKNTPQEAPSALNVVVVPNVTLPKVLHETFNKDGKDGY
ncbi:hypothetical protein GcM1_229046 [Golovinomyces cichoracearum]|uniref:Uncharacterized protein n=1 Tax=Golovinomyces cichoracearum TaxID=62708 RepID=A0A420INL6_9PEZI|nr:hypothetical protein GcM1_229046 [Golovinomyces cichoracearum]